MNQQNAKNDYSRITTYFTYFMMIGFVAITLYLDFFKTWIVRTPAYLNAIGIVPIVLIANVFLGIYYNVSNWYRLTDRTRYGLYSALIGVGLTIVFNILLVPRLGYMGTAWAMLICYAGMTIITYAWGQKYYPVPFEVHKILGAVIGGVLVYLVSLWIKNNFDWPPVITFTVHSLMLVLFVFLLFGKVITRQLKILNKETPL